MSNETIIVGLSQNWDASSAGKEIALDIIDKMQGNKPSFILLFSTIHYKDHGGFDNLLKGIFEIIPEETTLVGGTTAGFIIPQGCFTRGVAALAIKSENLDIAVAAAKNIKRNPKKAAEDCAEKIKKILTNSKFKNRLLLNFPSGITTPKIPGFPDNLRVIRPQGILSEVFSNLLLIGIKISLVLLQKGPGREEIIIETLSKKLPNYQIIGGSFVDDNKGYSNFQFFNRGVYTNMLITVGLSTDFQINVESNFGLTSRSQEFKITKTSLYDLVIEKINGKNAFNEILKILKWPSYFMEDSARILHRTFYTPIGYTIEGKQYVSVIAFIFGEKIMVSPKVISEDACIMATSGKQLIEIVDQNLKETIDKNLKFGVMVSCIVILETLGSSVYKIHEKLVNHFKNKPFILMFAVGEDICTPKLGAKRIAESHNTAIIYE